MTSTNARFFVNSNEMIVDRLNDANSGIARPPCDGYALIEDETDLREQLLSHHLERTCQNLLCPRKLNEQEPHAILGVITASHLNTFPHRYLSSAHFTDKSKLRRVSRSCGCERRPQT